TGAEKNQARRGVDRAGCDGRRVRGNPPPSGPGPRRSSCRDDLNPPRSEWTGSIARLSRLARCYRFFLTLEPTYPRGPNRGGGTRAPLLSPQRAPRPRGPASSCIERYFGGDRRCPAYPGAPARGLARRAREQRIEPAQALRRADVEPSPGVVLAAHLPARGRLAQQRRQGKPLRPPAGEERRAIDADAGEREARGAVDAHGALLEREVSAGVVRGVFHEHRVREPARSGMREPLERIAGPGVAVYHKKGVPEQGKRLRDTAAGLERAL